DFKIPDRSIRDIQQFKWPSRRLSSHSAEKPIDLIKWLIQISNASSVADFFMGSGTTAAACEQLGVNWIGMEGSVRWCDKIKKRLQA
ncbi:MAG: site-specific DNA-methyltransferase, partial [Desulfobacteraceae bacterium]|nr:site-specific DNA-methyltransferase [Desulfobacteraceae bacterium]